MDTYRPPKAAEYTADSRSTNHDAILSPVPSVESPKNTPELDPSSEEKPVQPAEEPLQLTPDHDKNVLTNLHQTPLTPKARTGTVHLDHRPTASTSCTPCRQSYTGSHASSEETKTSVHSRNREMGMNIQN